MDLVQHLLDWGSALWRSPTLGVQRLGLPLLDLVKHPPVLKKQYRGLFNANAVWEILIIWGRHSGVYSLHSAGLQFGIQEARATDFGSGHALIGIYSLGATLWGSTFWVATLRGPRSSGYQFWIWSSIHLCITGVI